MKSDFLYSALFHINYEQLVNLLNISCKKIYYIYFSSVNRLFSRKRQVSGSDYCKWLLCVDLPALI